MQALAMFLNSSAMTSRPHIAIGQRSGKLAEEIMHGQEMKHHAAHIQEPEVPLDTSECPVLHLFYFAFSICGRFGISKFQVYLFIIR